MNVHAVQAHLPEGSGLGLVRFILICFFSVLLLNFKCHTIAAEACCAQPWVIVRKCVRHQATAIIFC